jgi:hypothetical protein
VSFVNDTVGVIAGLADGTILFTTSGGLNWQTVQTGMMSSYFAADMATERAGIVAGINTVNQPFVTTTWNGWTTFHDYSFYPENGGTNFEGTIAGVHLWPDGKACAVITTWDEQGAICRSLDSGRTWQTVHWSPNAYFAVDFPTPAVGYAVGWQGVISKTLDSGATWTDDALPQFGSVSAVSFVDENRGWAAVDSGRIIHTVDGGREWSLQPTGLPTETWMRGISFANADTGFAVTDVAVLRTTTGGGAPGEFRRVAPVDYSITPFTPGESAPVTFAWTRSVCPDTIAVRYHLFIRALYASMEFDLTDTTITDSLRDLWDVGYYIVNCPVTWTVSAIHQLDTLDASNHTGLFTLVFPIVDVGDRPDLAPHQFALSNYPNPFNPTTEISFSLPRESETLLRVFNIEGRTVFEKAFGVLAAGEHRMQFEARDLPSGVYVARVETVGRSLARKMVLLK